jgi:nitrous oxidase accessory protein NosD
MTGIIRVKPGRGEKAMKAQRNAFLTLGLILAALLASACMDTVYVDAGASGPGIGSPEAPFQRIATGLFWAASDAAVYVAAGDYSENLVISKPVRLLGAGSGSTRLLADVTGKGIEIRADNVEVRGFSIVGVGQPDPEDIFLGGIYAEDVNNLIVSENSVGPYSSMGIGVGRASNVMIEDNQVLGISGVLGMENHGIIVALAQTTVVRNNVVDTVEGSGLSFNESGGDLESNTLTNCLIGLWVARSNWAEAEVSLRGNVVQDSSLAAAIFGHSTISALYDNVIVDNPGVGLEIYDTGTLIVACGNNTISGNSPDFGENLQYYGYLDVILACLD